MSKSLYFIGIKGSGMASLALIAKSLGYEVSGSDVDLFIFTQKQLEAEQIPIRSFSRNNIQDYMTVVIGNSFDQRNLEVDEAFKNKTVTTYRYREFLALLIKQFTSIGVAGSHGKTTTTGILTALLSKLVPTGYLIGDGSGKLVPEDQFFVVEADEYSDTFLSFYPDYAIITNIDLDHVDYFLTLERYIQSFQTFVNQVNKGIVVCWDDQHVRTLDYHQLSVVSYGIESDARVKAVDIKESRDGSEFLVQIDGEIVGMAFISFVGRHYILNSLASIAMAWLLEQPIELVLKHVSSFKGQRRRFIIEEENDAIYIDDYAHHPTEIKVTIDACRRRYPDYKLVLVYKPDRLSRAQYFEKEFYDALHQADVAYITPFYSGARAVEDIPYDLEDFVKAMKDIEVVEENSEGARVVAAHGPACYLFVSTKDVYKLKDLVKEVHQNEVK